MKLHSGFLKRISFIITLDPAAVTGCELDVGFLCDKATVIGEEVTDVLYYMILPCKICHKPALLECLNTFFGVVKWTECFQ
jgi:hypothetical protein